jgi:hypothetical protein
VSEIESHFSKRKLDVKAFLFVQTNRDVAQRALETRVAILSNNDSQTEELCWLVKGFRGIDP